MRGDGLMTVGELARRTGLSIKAIRQYAGLGLIYSAGGSESGYRLFDDSALRCAQVISRLRSLGLTIKEITELGRAHVERPGDPLGPRLAALLSRATQRIDDQIASLVAVRRRIDAYRAEHAAALTGDPDAHVVRLLAAGEPVALERLATASGVPVETVQAMLDEQTSAERDEQGRLVGFGLTLRPTPHRYTADGRTLYGWCATDTLMVPAILGRPALIESTCPQTGQQIRIEVTPDVVARVDPPDAVLTAVRPAGRFADVRASTCQFGHFFSSRAAAAEWAAEHPDGYIHPVKEAFQLERQVVEQLGWNAHPSEPA